jgi:hypothetical protein
MNWDAFLTSNIAVFSAQQIRLHISRMAAYMQPLIILNGMKKRQ